MQTWQEQIRALLGSAQGGFGVYAATPTFPLFEYQASSLFPSAGTIKVLDAGLVYGARDPLILCLMATQLVNNGEGAVILGKVAAITYTTGEEECAI